MKRPGIEAYPELEKFIHLYWNQGVVQAGADFVDVLKLFRDDALSTPETRPMFKKLMDQLREAEARGFIRDKISHATWVEFWGRNQCRIPPKDVERAMRAFEGTMS